MKPNHLPSLLVALLIVSVSIWSVVRGLRVAGRCAQLYPERAPDFYLYTFNRTTCEVSE
jgi:hypothetical protein